MVSEYLKSFVEDLFPGVKLTLSRDVEKTMDSLAKLGNRTKDIESIMFNIDGIANLEEAKKKSLVLNIVDKSIARENVAIFLDLLIRDSISVPTGKKIFMDLLNKVLDKHELVLLAPEERERVGIFAAKLMWYISLNDSSLAIDLLKNPHKASQVLLLIKDNPNANPPEAYKIVTSKLGRLIAVPTRSGEVAAEWLRYVQTCISEKGFHGRTHLNIVLRILSQREVAVSCGDSYDKLFNTLGQKRTLLCMGVLRK